jgi:hypothetical protein
MMALFVMLNFTSSGGIFRPDLQNGFFGALHAFWNGAGFLEGARDHVYFDGRAGFGGHLATLVVWFAVGAVLLAVAATAERRRATAAAAVAATGGATATAAGVTVAPDRAAERHAQEEEEMEEAVGV